MTAKKKVIKKSKKNKKGSKKGKKISKMNAELVAFIGGSCGDGCTSGDFGTLIYDILKTGVGVVEGIVGFGETAWWMMVDMPNELLGAVESPSSNVPLTNII